MSDEETGMEVENLDSTEQELDSANSEITETPIEAPAEKTETPEAKAEAEAKGLLESEGESEDLEIPQYTPNFKFKASGKDREVPEIFKSLITDEDSEKAVKGLFQRAFGADALIEKNEKLGERLVETSRERDLVKGGVDSLRQIYTDATKHPSEGGNLLKLDQFFAKLKIPTDVILQYAVARVQLEQLPSDQRDAIVARLKAEERNQALTMEQGDLRGQGMDATRELKRYKLNEVLTSPEVAPVVEAFDKRMGKTGAFFDAVANHGQLAWYRQKIDLPPDQAVKEVIAQYGLNAPVAPSEPKTPGSNAPAAGRTRPVVQRTTKVIPNVQGKSNLSPLKDKPRSIEDIKKLSARANAGEAV